MEFNFLEQIFTLKNITIYLIAINIISFLMMWYDKHEAKINQWRISEKALFGFAIAGGSIGGTIGMYVFHHKTKKRYFKFGFPIIIIIQIAILLFVLRK